MTSQISSTFIAAGPVSKSDMRLALNTAQAEISRLQGVGPFYLSTVGGTAAAVTGTIGSGATIPALTDGLTVLFRAPVNISTGASFQLNALTPKLIRFFNEKVLTSIYSGMVDTGMLLSLTYTGADDCWILDLPTSRSVGIVERWAVSGETADLTTGANAMRFRIVGNFRLTGIRASLSVASSAGNVQIAVYRNGVNICSTNPTIDALEKTSTTAATPAVLSTTSLTDDDEIATDIITAGTGARGLKVALLGIPA
jgi:hypothetical protein